MYKIKFKNGTEKKFESLIDADLYGADLKGAYLKSANLYGADLRGADLSDANLHGANLHGAYLKSADLSGADLRLANLSGADLEDTSIISANLGRHFAFFHEGYLKIGCKGENLEWWLKKYKEVGKENSYSKFDLELYKMFIDICRRSNEQLHNNGRVKS